METNQALRRAALMRGRTPATGLAAGGPAAGGGAGATAGQGRKPCYFFNHSTCHNTDENCKFAHVRVSDDEKAKMVKPGPRSGSPTRSPRRAGGGGGGSGGNGGGAAPAANKQQKMHCFNFIKGKCDKGDDCAFAHLDAAVVKEMERAAKVKAKAAAKAEPKAKAQPQK